MIDLATIRQLLHYNDWADRQILVACEGLSDEQLDRVFDIGRGSLRRLLLHILAGESVWVKRWQGNAETPWPNEDEPASVGMIASRFAETVRDRSLYLGTIDPPQLDRTVIYRDSKGSLFMATLGDMMIQMCLHSVHHRAQAVNVLRRLGATPPELDYMMWIRRPVIEQPSPPLSPSAGP